LSGCHYVAVVGVHEHREAQGETTAIWVTDPGSLTEIIRADYVPPPMYCPSRVNAGGTGATALTLLGFGRALRHGMNGEFQYFYHFVRPEPTLYIEATRTSEWIPIYVRNRRYTWGRGTAIVSCPFFVCTGPNDLETLS